MQLDIFSDSRDIMLRNDVVHALEKYDAIAGRAAWKILSTAYPHDDILPNLSQLITLLEQRSTRSFPDHDALHQARRKLAAIEASAWRLFGKHKGTEWLKPLWCELAQRAALLPFRQDDSEAHAAVLWLHAQGWAVAMTSVATIASWRRIPYPLAWMAEARYRQDGLRASWPLLAELAWISPNRFDLLTQRLADPVIAALRAGFDSNFEGSNTVTDLTWFPAWVLMEQADLAAPLKEAQSTRHNAPERAFQLLMELLVLEKQGRHHEVIEHRRVLQGLQPSLFAAYLATRQ